MTDNNGCFAEKTLETAFGSVHYWISDFDRSKPWLVFLPGLTADHHLFQRQLAFFHDKLNCLAWDAPAHGRSRPFCLTFSMCDMARYLHDIFEKESIVQPVLVGQSLGGYLSQAYMELFPNTVSGFVSIDSCPLKRSYYTGWELALLKRTKWMYRSIPWRLLIKWGAHGTAKSEYGRQLMRQTMEAFEKKEYCALADHGYRILAEAVEENKAYNMECPTLLLCGKKDGAGSAKRYNRRWANQEGHTLIWLEGAGHNSNTDAPEQVNQIIHEFVRSIKR